MPHLCLRSNYLLLFLTFCCGWRFFVFGSSLFALPFFASFCLRISFSFPRLKGLSFYLQDFFFCFFSFVPSLHRALRQHGLSHLEEACNVRADHIIARRAVLGSGAVGSGENALHNALQLRIHLFKRPR